MINKDKTLELLRYINTPLTKESINVLYMANNIKHEKCALYNSIIQSLIIMIFDTYMGDDITDKQQQINHFKWCWDKNLKNFKEEGIDIYNEKLYQYFLGFMLDVYYPITKKDENQSIQNNILKLWAYIFNYNNVKTKSDVDTMIEVYTLFELGIKSN